MKSKEANEWAWRHFEMNKHIVRYWFFGFIAGFGSAILLRLVYKMVTQ